jgi:hypothetical protein
MSDKSTEIAPPRRKRLRIAAYAVLAVGVLLGIGVALLPTAATWQIETQLEKLGAKSVKVGTLRINPATGEIWVEEFKSVGPDGEDIVVGKAKLRIGWSALVNRRITIHELSVADADIDIRLDAKGVWSVGGFPMVFASSEAPAEPSDPWQLEAGNIAIDNSQMTLNLGTALQKALVEKLRIDKLTTLTPGSPATMSLSVMTGGGKVTIGGRIFPFAKEPNAELSINTAALKLDAFKDLIATGRIKDISGIAAINGTAKAGFRASGGPAISFDGKASLSRARVQTTLFQTNAKSLSWNGTGRISLPDEKSAAGALPEIQVQGVAAADGFAFVNRVSKVALSADTARFNLSKSGISIKADPTNTGTTIVSGELIAKLTKAKFDQPETELTIAPDQINLNSRVTLTLPPQTAAFSATLSGVMDAKALGGSLKPAGLDRLDVKSFRVAYENAVLNVSDRGAISGTVSAQLDLDGVLLEAPQLGGHASARSLKSTGNRISFGQTDTGALTLSLDGALTATDLSTESTNKSWRASQKTAEWTGSIGLDPTMGAAPADGFSLSGDVKLTGFDATLAADDPFRIKLESANVIGIAIAPANSSVSKAAVSGLSTAGPTDKSPLPRIALKTLLATDITTDADGGLGITALRASGLSGRLVRSLDGGIAMPAVPVEASIAEPAGVKSETRNRKAATIRIGSAVLSDSSIAFVDNAVEPPFSIETSQLQATLRDFDTSKPQSDARLNVLLGLGKFGRVQLDGTVKPDLENTNANLGIGFKNIELFKFNAYILPAIKHTIRQGRADGEIDLKLNDSRINATTALKISRLEVTPAPQPKGGKESESGPPIESALGLIQDKNGIVKLSIPITGSLEDPKFDLSDAIGQAIGGAMQKTFMTAVKIAFPLGTVVAIVDAVGGPKIAVKPLEFTSGSATLSPALKGRIAEIAAYLKKKPKEAPSMCGPATASDLAALRKVSPKADRKAAIDLAAARVSAVRNELVSTHGLQPNRFFICGPEFVDAPDTVPSVMVDLKS